LRSEIDTERQANNGKDEEIKRLRRSLDQSRKEQQAAAAMVKAAEDKAANMAAAAAQKLAEEEQALKLKADETTEKEQAAKSAEAQKAAKAAEETAAKAAAAAAAAKHAAEEQAKKERQDAALAVRRAEIEAKVQAHLRSEIDTERQANNGKDEEIKRLRRSLDQIRKEQQAAAAAVAKAAAAAKVAETHSTPKKPTKANAGKSKPDESVSALKAEIAAMLQAEDAAVLGGVQKARLRLLETAKELAELEAVRPRLCVRACPHHGLSSRCGRWRCKSADPCCCAGA
jgi:colicin import membrane protein